MKVGEKEDNEEERKRCVDGKRRKKRKSKADKERKRKDEEKGREREGERGVSGGMRVKQS